MTNIINSNYQKDSFVGRDATNTVIQGQKVSDDQWQKLSKFAAKNEADDEYTQVRMVEQLVKEGKAEEAGKIWNGVKWFFDTAVARSANVAQIAEFVHEMLKKSGSC